MAIEYFFNVFRIDTHEIYKIELCQKTMKSIVDEMDFSATKYFITQWFIGSYIIFFPKYHLQVKRKELSICDNFERKIITHSCVYKYIYFERKSFKLYVMV